VLCTTLTICIIHILVLHLRVISLLTGIKPPFGAGFEGVGTIVAMGQKVKHVQRGQAVVFSQFGAFSEYITLPARQAIPVPSDDPSMIPLLVSGITASIALVRVILCVLCSFHPLI